MPSPLLLPLLACAVVLLVSGVAKLRAPDSVDAAFSALEVPAVLDTPVVRRLAPWLEVALGVGLLLATGAALVVVAALTLVLFTVYLLLVVRAVRRPEPVDCGCFGALGDAPVTRMTVWRNVLLVVAALLALVAGLQGVGLVGSVGASDALAWVSAAGLTTAIAVLVTYRAPMAPPPAAGPPADADGNYERVETPRAQVLNQRGELVLLAHETMTSAHLLVFLSPGCGPCERIGPDLARWAEQLHPVTLRAVVTAAPAVVESHTYLQGLAYYDPFGITRAAFGVRTPAAVLLGTDGLLAGGPVQGEDDVRAFVAEVGEHLREALEAGGLSDAR
ncbi:MAG: MauE/DoxX family redox-associated membrane protein [Ornithinibacter sp.]